jgi:hypothetical protein
MNATQQYRKEESQTLPTKTLPTCINCRFSCIPETESEDTLYCALLQIETTVQVGCKVFQTIAKEIHYAN